MGLTKYKTASFRELWSIAYPLMLTALSGNLMVFMDRFLLCRYIPIAMAAATMVGMIFTMFQFASISIASIAEVFVGKYNGANENKNMGPLIWQMIWFSALTALVFWPVGFTCGKYFLPESFYQYGIPYFKTLMLFGPVFPLVAALSSFFIGQGKVKIITISTLVANALNIFFGYIFIFGIGHVLAPMGAFGAALACGVSVSLQALFLFLVFLQKKYRILNHTTQVKFNLNEFWRCIKIGTPNAFGYLIEMGAWAYLLQMMGKKDDTHIMVLAFGQAIFLLVAFVTDGLQKAIVTISSNILGEKKPSLLSEVILRALGLHGMLILLFAVPLLFFSGDITRLFFATDSTFAHYDLLLHYASITCQWILIYFMFDGLVWIFAGILTAYEDTFFVMTMNTVSVWLLAILPNYIAIEYFDANPSMIWKIMSLYACINAIGFAIRYFKFDVKKTEPVLEQKWEAV